MGLPSVSTGQCPVGGDAPRAVSLKALNRASTTFPPSSTSAIPFREATMLKLCYGALTVATLAATIVPVSAQQSSTPPAAAAAADSGQSTSPNGAFSYFVNLKNGDTVTSPFKVIFGLSPNMGVAPSGVEKANVGHHHVFIDTTLTAEEETQPITVDEHHVHFGKGQTETMLSLPPGKHTL